MKKIALISVSDKTNIDTFASQLVKNNYTIISTGGTAKYLEDKGAAEIVDSDVSNSDALFKLLIDLENDHNRRESMGQKASLVFPPNTSESICKTINESLKIQTK